MPLTPEQVSSYLTRGFFVLPAFFAEAELRALRPSVPSGAAPPADAATFDKCVVFGCARTGEDPTKINKLEGLGRLAESPFTTAYAFDSNALPAVYAGAPHYDVNATLGAYLDVVAHA